MHLSDSMLVEPKYPMGFMFIDRTFAVTNVSPETRHVAFRTKLEANAEQSDDVVFMILVGVSEQWELVSLIRHDLQQK